MSDELPIRDENGNLTRKLTLDDILNDTYDAVDYWTNRVERLEQNAEKALEEGKLHRAYALYRDIQLEIVTDKSKNIKEKEAFTIRSQKITKEIAKKVIRGREERKKEIVEKLYEIAVEAEEKYNEARFIKSSEILLSIEPDHYQTINLLIDNALREKESSLNMVEMYVYQSLSRKTEQKENLEIALYINQIKNNKEKKEHYQKLIEKHFPNFKPNPLTIGKILFANKNYEQAIPFLERAIKESENHHSHLLLGKIYYDKNDFDKSVNHLTKARKIKETFTANKLLNNALIEKEMFIEANKIIERNYLTSPDQPKDLASLTTNLIIINGKEDELEKKEKIKEKIINSIIKLINNPRTKKELAGYTYANLHQTIDNEKIKNDILSTAYNIAPEKYNIAIDYAEVLIKKHEFERANIVIQRILEEHPNGYRNNMLLGTEQLIKKNHIGAMSYFFSAISDINSKAISYQKKTAMFNLKSRIQENFAQIGNVEKIINETREYLQNNKIDNSMGDFFVTLLDYTSKDDESNQIAKEVIEMFKQNPQFLETLEKGTQLQPTGINSKNNVNTVNTSALSHNIYIIKTQNKNETAEEAVNRLRYEFTTTTFVEESLKQAGIKPKTSKVLDAFINNNKPYLFIKRINQPTLQETTLTEKEKNQEIEYAIETLANIHTATKQNILQDEKGIYMNLKTEQGEQKIYLPINNKINELVQRTFTRKKGDVRPRFGVTEHTQELINNYQGLLQGQQHTLDNLFFIHDDAFITNVLKEGYIIDFEKSKLGNPLRDIYTFIDNPLFSNINSEVIIQKYINNLSKQFNNAQIINIVTQGKEERLFNLFRQLGASMQQGKEELAQFYSNKLLELAPSNIKDSFVKCIQESPHEYIKKVL